MTSAPPVPHRRDVLGATAALAAAAVTPPALAAAAGVLPSPVTLFDPEAFASGPASALAIEGDRIRFARSLFRERRPRRLTAMTRYADFLLLAECAGEEGYRTRLLGRAPAPQGGELFLWSAERS